MELRKIGWNALIFLVVTSLLYFTVFLSLSKINISGVALIYRASEAYGWKGGNTFRKFNEFNINEKHDVIVLGSSHAYRAYDPRIFKKNGISMFNMGTNAQTPINSYWVAKNYITSANCNLLLFEVYDASLASDGFESCADLVPNVSSGKAAFDIATSYKNPQILNMLLLRLINTNKPAMYIDSAYIEKGFSEKKDSIKKSLPTQTYLSKLEPQQNQLDYLEKTLIYFKECGIETVVITHPFPKEKSLANHLIFHRLVEQICEKYKIEYLDFSFKHNYNSNNCFYDTHHLNQNGVNLFNNELIKELKIKKIL